MEPSAPSEYCDLLDSDDSIIKEVKFILNNDIAIIKIIIIIRKMHLI